MYAAPSVQRRKVWLTPNTGMPSRIAAKTRKSLKFARVPQTRQQISAARGLKFTILRGHTEEILLLNKFFWIVDTCLICEDIARQSCAMDPRLRLFWRFFACCIFSESRATRFRLHSKFTLMPHHVWKYGRHSISDH